MFRDVLVGVRGAGDLATGAAYRLYQAGFSLVLTEVSKPLCVRRTVSLAEAVFEGQVQVEDLVAERVDSLEGVEAARRQGHIPVLVDPEARSLMALRPTVLIDAIMAKKNIGTTITQASVVIALGPGFTAGRDVHAVVETNRGHFLGRVLLAGTAEPDTGVPGAVMGYTNERLLRAPADGTIETYKEIGDQVAGGEVLGRVNGQEVKAAINGILRGLVRNGLPVRQGMKVGDVDPRCQRSHCFTISDKALAIGGGVLEAILRLLPVNAPEAIKR